MLVRATVEIIPDWVRERLGLTARHGLRPWERWIVRSAGNASDRIVLSECPAAQSCMRLGLPTLSSTLPSRGAAASPPTL